MATKQKYLSAKWKLGTKSGIPHGITGIIVFFNNQDMQPVCCVIKEIPAFQKVGTICSGLAQATTWGTNSIQKLVGHFFFYLIFCCCFGLLFAADRCVYLFHAGHVFFYSQYTKADVFILFAWSLTCIHCFFSPACRMCFTCLRSGLSFFASIKICFFSRTPFLLLLI